MQKIFKETCELRDEILEALYIGNYQRATALMVNTKYAILLLRRRGIFLFNINAELFTQISRNTIRGLEKLNLDSKDLQDCIEIKEKHYIHENIFISELLVDDLNSFGREGKSILFSTLESEEIAYWFILLNEQDICDGMDLYIYSLQRNIHNEIFQYKLYMKEESFLRNFILGKDNSGLFLSNLKNEKFQSLLHLSAIKKDWETFQDCLDYLSLNIHDEDEDGNSALDLISDKVFLESIQDYLY